jgi:bacterioferritin-associated ferredoxin
VEIVCLCNGITDEEMRRAVCCGARRPREVYEASGHRAQCGKCTRDVLALIRAVPPTRPELRA